MNQNPNRPFFALLSETEKSACMDYLHGHIIDGNFQAACFYEYGRESKALQYAAKLRRRLIRKPDWGYIKDGEKEIPFAPNLDDRVLIRTARKFGMGDCPW